MITHKEYMGNSSALHQAYYLQFATAATFHFVETHIGVERLRKSTDPYFNDVVKHKDNHWVWDNTPINLSLAYELDAVSPGYLPSPATATCVGKAAARELLRRLDSGEVQDEQ